jgi:methionine sulfoxide reductase heme-binding subunit
MVRESRWMDGVSLILSVFIVTMAGLWLTQAGTFNASIMTNSRASWYLVRGFGITAYILLTFSVLWGLALSTSAVKPWSPGPLSMLIHATISWTALVFGMVHGLLLMFDGYYTYHITNLLVPFTGPYRPVAVGLGIIGFWILVIVTPSFAFRKRLFSYRTWKLLHYLSYVAFVLVTAHGLTAGTDASRIGFRLLFFGSLFLSMVLLVYRIQNGKGSRPARARVPSRIRS